MIMIKRRVSISAPVTGSIIYGLEILVKVVFLNFITFIFSTGSVNAIMRIVRPFQISYNCIIILYPAGEAKLLQPSMSLHTERSPYMMQNNQSLFLDGIKASPIIASARNLADIDAAIKTDVRVIFILGGNILTIADYVARVRDAGRIAIVHMDLVAGLTSKDISVKFLHDHAHAQGITTTKAALIPYARELGMASVLRYFVLDSMASENIKRQNLLAPQAQPDAVEILPGVISSRVMSGICAECHVPVIAGGLIQDREDVYNALKSGCTAISSSHRNVWRM